MLTYPTPFINTATALFPPLSAYVYQNKTVMPQVQEAATFNMDAIGSHFQVGLGGNEIHFLGFQMDPDFYDPIVTRDWNDLCRTQWDNADNNIAQIRMNGCYGIFMRPDGNQAYLFGEYSIDSNSSAVVTLNTSTGPYSINNYGNGVSKTAIFESRVQMVPMIGAELVAMSVNIKSDGTRIICQERDGGGTPGNYRQFDLSIPWDMSTIVDSGISIPQTTTGLKSYGYIPPHGEEIYTFGSSNAEIFRHTMPVAWDLSSLPSDPVPYQSRSFKGQTGQAAGRGIHITADRLFIYDNGTTSEDNLHQYNVV